MNCKKASIEADSSTSSKPSSTNGFKTVVQNNREKTGRKPRRAKGHKKSEAELSKTPNEVIEVPAVRTCTCGVKTENVEMIVR